MRLRTIAIPIGALLLALLPGIPAQADPVSPSTTTPSDAAEPPNGLFDTEPRPGLDGFTYTARDGKIQVDDTSARSLAPEVIAEDAQQVQVRFETPTGAAPQRMQVNLQNQDSGKVYYLTRVGDHVVGGLVPPGEYTTIAYAQIPPSADVTGFATMTYREITITDQPIAWAVTMADLKRLDFHTDRAATLDSIEFKLQTTIRGGPIGMSYTTILEGNWELYSIPTGQTDLLYAARPTLLGPDGSDYSYHLVFHSDQGIPANLSYKVPDRALNRIASDYQTRGEPFLLMRTSYGRIAGGYDSAFVTPRFRVDAPSTRTEYFTADSAVEWFHQAEFGYADQPVPDWVVRYGGFYEPGRGRVQWGDSPVGPSLVPSRYQYALGRSGDRITGITPLFSGPDSDEITWSKVGLTGTSVLTKDGVELGRNTTKPEVQWFALPAGDSGTYQLTVDADHTVPWSDLGTHATAQWTFPSAPGTGRQTIDLSTVSLNATGVDQGYAPRQLPQAITLDVQRQGKPAETTSMTMDVSYDDGQTWRSVPLLRDGDHALAFLRHPAGASYVSTRLTAADDAGNSVSSTTIRSYGLK